MAIDPAATVRSATDQLEPAVRDAAEEARVRGKELAEVLVERAGVLRDELGERAHVVGDEVGARAKHLGEELGTRAEHWVAVARDRAEELEEDLPVDRERAAQYARFGLWQAIRALLVVVTAVPRLVVQLLGRLADVADDLSERGADVAERTKELTEAVPPSAARRRRQRRRTVALVGGGFVAGVVAGTVVSRRRAPIVTYDPPLPPVTPVPAFAQPSSSTGDVAVREAGVGGQGQDATDAADVDATSTSDDAH